MKEKGEQQGKDRKQTREREKGIRLQKDVDRTGREAMECWRRDEKTNRTAGMYHAVTTPASSGSLTFKGSPVPVLGNPLEEPTVFVTEPNQITSITSQVI